MTGTRRVTALITAPVLAALLFLLGSGVLAPWLIDPGPGLPTYRALVLLAGLGCAGALAIAASRSTGRVRWSWIVLAGCTLLWMVAVDSALLGWDDAVVWGGLRGASTLVGAGSLLLAPQLRRSLQEWGLILLDGWLVSGSVLLIGWVALAYTGSSPAVALAVGHPALTWVPIDLCFASVTVGLAMRTERDDRVPVLLMVLVSLLAVTGDTSWALTMQPQFPVVQWLILVTALAGASTSPRLDLWQQRTDGSPQPRLLRWSQVAVVPGLVAALCLPADPVVAGMAFSVIAGMAGEIVLFSRQNQELWTALHRQASTDSLTGLFNRHAFLELLDRRLAAGPAAVLFVDLDGFKAVNDTDGHAVGDRLLREVAQALRDEVGDGDLPARLGGDEFAVLTRSADTERADLLAARVTERLRRIPSDPARRTGASVGVAIGQGVSGATLLGDADLAMYEAKAAGGRRHVVFEPGMRERVNERARIRAELELACRGLGGQGLRLDVQPIVTLNSGRWVGFEALVRWRDGARVRSPEEFLPLAEETGLIVPIGSWVLRESLTWLAGWPEAGAGISVNLAGRQVAAAGFTELVASELERSGVAPHRLTLEITEQTAVEDIERAGAVLQPLRSLGVHVSLDDFGTGFSSLGYLAQLPVDELKIDRRFVAGLGRRAEDDALVRAVTGLASDLGLRVVAEGVETSQQAAALVERGCLLGQGFRFLAPTPIDLIVPAAA